MKEADFYAAVFGIIKNNSGEILFQKRLNTGFRDGMYQLPSGHIEGRETMKEAMVRELKEELNIIVNEKYLNIVHINHTICPDRVYFNVYIEVKQYEGVIENMEKNKCSELIFKSIEEIFKDEKCGYEKDTLEKILNGEYFGEKIVRKN